MALFHQHHLPNLDVIVCLNTIEVNATAKNASIEVNYMITGWFATIFLLVLVSGFYSVFASDNAC
jgi:hypothetical protein